MNKKIDRQTMVKKSAQITAHKTKGRVSQLQQKRVD